LSEACSSTASSTASWTQRVNALTATQSQIARSEELVFSNAGCQTKSNTVPPKRLAVNGRGLGLL